MSRNQAALLSNSSANRTNKSSPKRQQITVQPISENQLVGGLKTGQGWLSSTSKQSIDKYRAFLHLAFEKAQCNYKIRKGAGEAKKQYQKRAGEIELPTALTPALQQEYRTLDPPFPDLSVGDKLKLVKVSRSCSKKQLDRYFHLDPEKENIVYYKNQGDTKPMKSLSLDDCEVTVEKKD